MWKLVEKEIDIDIVSETKEWESLEEICISCYKIKFKGVNGHKLYQIMWYLKDKDIHLVDIEKAIGFLNYLNSINVDYKLYYNWFKTKKRNIYANLYVFLEWYLPIKKQYILQRIYTILSPIF